MSTEGCVNIGDYVQAVAAKQFLPQLDGFIQRERLDEYKGEQAAVIMNGWYMFQTEHWPPTDNITPLFVAFHLNSTAEDGMLTEEGIAYLKKHEPIGCRDLRTRDILLSKGIDAYFSGCLTLTLGEKFKNSNKTDDIYFVDVPITRRTSFIGKMIDGLYGLMHYRLALKIAKSYYWTENASLKHIHKGGAFIRQYRKMFEWKILEKATFVNHMFPNDKSDKEFLQIAESFIKKYASARLVVTNRIHCALPCLGLGTNVIYIEDPGMGEFSACRLDGLRELFNCLLIKNGKLHRTEDFPSKKITLNNIPANKSAWKRYRDLLVEKCTAFINSTRSMNNRQFITPPDADTSLTDV
jgi:hypothetical protein